MSSPEPYAGYDYTEGASIDDIEQVTTRPSRWRRDSQVGSSYGDADHNDGAVFDGPGSFAIPSSVSRMSHREMSVDRDRRLRRMSSEWRRGSTDNLALRRRESRESVQDQVEYASPDHSVAGDVEEDIAGSYRRSTRGRRRSISPEQSRSVFDNLAHIFGATPSRRPRQGSDAPSRYSRRSSRNGSVVSVAESGQERWGYSSGEEVDSEDELLVERPRDLDRGRASIDDFGSCPPSPTTSLPNMAHDNIFGDTRISMDISPERLDESSPIAGSRQTVFLPDEDMTIRFVGFETIHSRRLVWQISSVCTFGIVGLIGHWVPELWLRWVAKEVPFSEMNNGFVVVETPYKDITLFPEKTLDYPYSYSSAFSGKSETPLSQVPSRTSIRDKDPLKTLKVIDYRYSRFILNPKTGKFSMLREWRDKSWTSANAVQVGLTDSVRSQRGVLFGPNIIDIDGKSTLSLLVEEVIHPFYVFQIASMTLWCFDDYYYYAFSIGLISVLSIATTLIDTKKTIARTRELSRLSCPISVYINDTWQIKDSTELVPGDIVNLVEPNLTTVPADIFLLSGDAIVNESMLTGESVPVGKVPVPDSVLAKWKETADVSPESAKSFLYCGTKVVRVRGAISADGGYGSHALGLVARTGFNTTKGSLIRSMLFPKPLGFKFYQDSIRFICVLALIAGLGFLLSLVQFIRLGIQWQTIVIRALDLITIVVPPALPATLSIGTSFALSRLRKAGIFCISPNRVNVSGKINVCCFDKTGTLTEDGLDILGVRGLEKNAPRFGELIDNVFDLSTASEPGKASFLQALATCHSLQVVKGEVVGDPLDMKMFEFTQWTLEEGQTGTGMIKDKHNGPRSAALVHVVVRPPGSSSFRLEDALKGNAKRAHFLELGVVRTFEFVSSLRRMSVIVKRLKSTSMEIYVKGAPEVMTGICDSDSFPEDYDDLLSYYTKRGYRVIAIAGKSIEGLSWLKAQRLKREQAESGLQFLGLIIFENKLKPGTAPVLEILRAAHLPCRMITGDNPLTAVSVARECNLIKEDAHVFYPAFIQGDVTTPYAKLSWSSMDDPQWKLDDYSLKPLPPPPHLHMVDDDDDGPYQDYTIALTGDVFRWMVNHAPLETLQRMLFKTQVFARMSPDEKNEIVERLQALGYTVLMCGDGANDCAALKAADVGLSLSEAEASVAAPFTSRTPDIGCVLEVLKEGRAALVTSFSCFKYMALYSLIQFTSVTLLYSFASTLGGLQFLYIDLFIIIPIAVAMGRALPFPVLHTKRPSASLVSKRVLASIIGQIVITATVQTWAFFWVRTQTWYIPPIEETIASYENTVLFLISTFQCIVAAAVFSIGPPYRKSIWTNVPLMLSIGILTMFSLVILFAPPRPLFVILELMEIPMSAKRTLFVVIVINAAVSTIYEKLGPDLIANALTVFLQFSRDRRRRDGKLYKAVDVQP